MEKIKGTIKKYISGKRRTKKLKPINCHPNTEKDRLKSRPTCMTSKVIKKIKEDYNNKFLEFDNIERKLNKEIK